MDNILQRMLAVDQEADEIVKAAHNEAEKIQIASRQRLSEENQAFERALNQECDQLLQSHLADLDARRTRMLAEADSRIAARQRQLAADAARQLPTLVGILCPRMPQAKD